MPNRLLQFKKSLKYRHGYGRNMQSVYRRRISYRPLLREVRTRVRVRELMMERLEREVQEREAATAVKPKKVRAPRKPKVLDGNGKQAAKRVTRESQLSDKELVDLAKSEIDL